MRLALAMGKTKRELLSGMDSYEYTEWRMYDEVEPIGTERDKYHTAYLAMTVYNSIGPLISGKKFQVKNLDNFLLTFGTKQTKEAQSQGEIRSTLVRLTKHFGGKILNKEEANKVKNDEQSALAKGES